MEPNNNYSMGYVSTTGTSVGTSLLGGTILDTYNSGITNTQISNSFNLTPTKQISQSFNLTPTYLIMQNKVAVFQIVRDEDDKIIKTEFIKELWVETKNGQSVDFQVARDKDLAEYEMSELSIRTIYTVTF